MTSIADEALASLTADLITAKAATEEEGLEAVADAIEVGVLEGGGFPGGGTTDASAIHVDEASEISGIATKGGPAAGDLVVIEDSADSFNKKSVDITAFLGGGGGDVVGPGGATDTGLALFDTGTGKLLKDSVITLDGSGNFGGTMGTYDGRDVSADGGVLDGHVADSANPHSTDIGNLGTGTLAELNSAVTDATLVDTGDARFSDDRTASGLRTATTVVVVSGATAPTVGQVITATSDVLATWQTPAGGGTPAGADTQVQFNDGGAFGASANLTWDGSTLIAQTNVLPGRFTNTLASDGASAIALDIGRFDSVSSQIGDGVTTRFLQQDSAGTAIAASAIISELTSVGVGTVDADLVLQTVTAGTVTEYLRLDGSLGAVTVASDLGVGKTPADRLDIEDDNNGESVVRNNNPNTGSSASAKYYATADGGSTQWGHFSVASAGTLLGSSNTDMAFFATTNASSLAFLATNSIPILIGNSNTLRLYVDTSGAVGIGSTDAPSANGSKVLYLGDNGATNPTMGTNSAGFFAKDVSASMEMFVIDEANNATQISPHDPVTGEWVYHSTNTRTGVTKRVNMERLVALVEGLAGEKLMEVSRDAPSKPWEYEPHG